MLCIFQTRGQKRPHEDDVESDPEPEDDVKYVLQYFLEFIDFNHGCL